MFTRVVGLRMTHLRQNLRGEESTNQSESLGDTRSNCFGKVQFGDFVEEQNCRRFLFLVVGRVSNFAGMIQETQLRVPPWCFFAIEVARDSFHSGEKSVNGSSVVFTSGMNFRKAVGQCVRTGSSFIPAARLRVWIPRTSSPRPHVEPTRRRWVGIALYEPKRLFYEGCFIRRGYGSYLPKYRQVAPRDSWCSDNFSEVPSDDECGPQVRSSCQHTYLTYLTIFISRNFSQFVDSPNRSQCTSGGWRASRLQRKCGGARQAFSGRSPFASSCDSE